MKLDHVVYFTNENLADVIEEQNQDGYGAVMGGRHEQWGTANALLYTNNAYIEWLTLEDREKAEKAAVDQPLVAQLLHDQSYGNGWATICFSVDHLENLKEELDNKGFQTTDIIPASRKTREGQLLRWNMLFIEQSSTDELPYPFFIEWDESEAQRFARLDEQGTRTVVHKKRSIIECIFFVEDPLRETGEWAVLLSQKVGDANDIRIGDVVFRFVEKQGVPERLGDVRFSDNG
ncbi:VOC family protein [Sporosarcina obsidiansis]|uniref:VOC family protein n=1 Tax=Sporosarcina obsidiansis TaxID=2660748 RepID=UPI001891AF71|nr:VOC family protein [Sporosarcina obsidiansis]